MTTILVYIELRREEIVHLFTLKLLLNHVYDRMWATNDTKATISILHHGLINDKPTRKSMLLSENTYYT